MNGSQALVASMVESIKSVINQTSSSVQVVVCPPFPYLGVLKQAIGDANIGIGAQNVHTQLSGAFTGEISVGILKDWQTTHCLVGHSERRSLFGETDQLVQEKTKLLLDHEIKPVICVGETLEQRESGQHESTVTQQLKVALKGLSSSELERSVVAYEPVWAIGTGKTASEEQANQMHIVIRKTLEEHATPDLAKSVMILYGGSVNAKNAGSLLQQSDIDGCLVGGASLKPEDFSQIIQAGL
ncbi:MAG: triose-phosphate isomerase [SAR324 cluster bacterium]|nr:triose-phosphate isomerase [SAR324 cluster bacterium]